MTNPSNNNPLADGAVNVPFGEPTPEAPQTWGFDSAGINDNYQATDHAAIDRHIK